MERDRRVRRECEALVAAGYDVDVVCPADRTAIGAAAAPPLPEGVRVHRYPAPREATTTLGYVWEYAYSLVMATVLTMMVAARDGVDAVQACNPPDVYFPIGWAMRAAGRPFVFDHHDLSPEVYLSRPGRHVRTVLWALRRCELATYAAASHVIATNESYRHAALRRGGKRPDEVSVVRNGPELAVMRPRPSCQAIKRGRDHLCVYAGVMGLQDGVDLAVRAIADLVHRHGRRDTTFVLVGDGPALAGLRALVHELGVDDVVALPGFQPYEKVLDHLATADVGLCPDPPGPFNDVSSMIKTTEYMAFGLPVVAFDLPETRHTAGEAAVYAGNGDPSRFAAAIDALLDDPDRRRLMGEHGRRRVAGSLAWEHQRDAYVRVYDRLLRAAAPARGATVATSAGQRR